MLPSAANRPLAVQGEAELEVEQRRSAGEGFGKGHRIPLAFGEALRRMAGGDASLYITTQVGAGRARLLGAAGQGSGADCTLRGAGPQSAVHMGDAGPS